MLTPSLLALLLANAFPIVGVLFLGWTVFPLVLLYWLENVVVGRAAGRTPQVRGRRLRRVGSDSSLTHHSEAASDRSPLVGSSPTERGTTVR